MATIIDALVVTLGLDASKWSQQSKKVDQEQKKTKDALVKGGKEIEGQTRKGVEAMSALKREVVGLLAAFTAGVGLKQFVGQITDSDAMVGRLAKQIGVSTEELSLWQGVLRRSGGDAADATNLLSIFNQAFQSFATTGNAGLPFINLLSAYGNVDFSTFKNPAEAILNVADAMKKLAETEGQPRAAFVGRQMGFSPADISLLVQGRAALEAQLEEQKKVSVISDQNAAAAQRMQDAFSKLKQKATDLGRNLLTSLAPAVKTVTDWLIDLGKWAADNRPIVEGAFLGLGAAAVALGVALAAPVAPYIALAAAIGAVAAAIAIFLDANPEAVSALKELGSAAVDLFSFWLRLGDAIKTSAIGRGIAESLKPAGPVVSWLINSLRELASLMRLLADLSKGDWGAALKDAKDVGTDWLAASGLGKPRPFAKPPAANAPKASGSTPPAANAPTTVAQKAASAKLEAYLLSRGAVSTADQAKGAVAGAFAESNGLDPNAVNPKSGAFGIIQVLGPRKAAMLAKYGPRPSFDQQAEFMADELLGRYGAQEAAAGRALRATTSSQAALSTFISRYERPAAGRETLGDLARGDAQLAANAPARRSLPNADGLAANAPARFAGPSTTINRTDVRIDRIEVVTQATDAAGIARDLGPAIRKRTFVPQANRGLG